MAIHPAEYDDSHKVTGDWVSMTREYTDEHARTRTVVAYRPESQHGEMVAVWHGGEYINIYQHGADYPYAVANVEEHIVKGDEKPTEELLWQLTEEWLMTADRTELIYP